MDQKKLGWILIGAVVVVGLALLAGMNSSNTTTSEVTEKSVVGGTTTETTTKQETTTEEDGDWSRETETKTTVDPEGLMNKKTVVDESTSEQAQ